MKYINGDNVEHIIGRDHRLEYDLNRHRSRAQPFRHLLRNKIQAGDTHVDIHSYPVTDKSDDWYKFDTVVFEHGDGTLTKNIKKHLSDAGYTCKVANGDHINDVCCEATDIGANSCLVEFNSALVDDNRLDGACEAVAKAIEQVYTRRKNPKVRRISRPTDDDDENWHWLPTWMRGREKEAQKVPSFKGTEVIAFDLETDYPWAEKIIDPDGGNYYVTLDAYLFDAKNNWKLHKSIHGIDKHIVLDSFDDATPISAKKWKKLLQGEDISNWALVTWQYNSKDDDVNAVKIRRLDEVSNRARGVGIAYIKGVLESTLAKYNRNPKVRRITDSQTKWWELLEWEDNSFDGEQNQFMAFIPMDIEKKHLNSYPRVRISKDKTKSRPYAIEIFGPGGIWKWYMPKYERILDTFEYDPADNYNMLMAKYTDRKEWIASLQDGLEKWYEKIGGDDAMQELNFAEIYAWAAEHDSKKQENNYES